MADSVSLVRLKVKDPTLAIQDETMNAVVTLAAIELGKGNADVSRTHIEGVKSMVRMRGGIENVKATSPLTARMVSWYARVLYDLIWCTCHTDVNRVSMIVMQHPQFTIQDDSVSEDTGIAPILPWHKAAEFYEDSAFPLTRTLGLDPIIGDILRRLRNLFHNPERFTISPPEFHDLTCFILHRLLILGSQQAPHTGTSESVRVAIAIYMLIIHGPTYYSHAGLQYKLMQELRVYLAECFSTVSSICAPLATWLVSVGMVASKGTPESLWFQAKAKDFTRNLGVYDWKGVLDHLEEVLWAPRVLTEQEFRESWELVWATDDS